MGVARTDKKVDWASSPLSNARAPGLCCHAVVLQCLPWEDDVGILADPDLTDSGESGEEAQYEAWICSAGRAILIPSALFQDVPIFAMEGLCYTSSVKINVMFSLELG